MLFDTHAHVLSADRDRYPYSTLRGGEKAPVSPVVFPVEELVQQMGAGGVDFACVVQRATLYGYDNSYTLDAAADYAEKLVPIVVLDAQDGASPGRLRDIVSQGHRLAGLRVVAPKLTKDETDWLDGDDALGLWAVAADLGLPLAVILYRMNNEAGRAALLNVARRFPSLPIIIDHVGLPHPSTPEKKWCEANGIDCTIPMTADFGIADHLAAFDELDNVHFKVTDINFDRLAEAQLDSSLFLRMLVDRFGAARLVWGSDVGQSPAPYAEKIARLHASAAQLSTDERAGFFGGTAYALYGKALKAAGA